MRHRVPSRFNWTLTNGALEDLSDGKMQRQEREMIMFFNLHSLLHNEDLNDLYSSPNIVSVINREE